MKYISENTQNAVDIFEIIDNIGENGQAVENEINSLIKKGSLHKLKNGKVVIL